MNRLPVGPLHYWNRDEIHNGSFWHQHCKSNSDDTDHPGDTDYRGGFRHGKRSPTFFTHVGKELIHDSRHRIRVVIRD